MSFRSIIFTAMAVAVMGALVLLFAEAGEPPETEISERALERAKQRHERAKSRATAAPRAPEPASEMKQWKRSSAERDATGFPPPDTSSIRKAIGKPPHKRSTDSDRPSLRVPKKRALGQDDGDGADLQTRMREVNRMYDRRDYESALTAAKEVLANKPGNVRMLRVVVSSACIMGEADEARKHYTQLPPRHQKQMARRCSRYGMEFED